MCVAVDMYAYLDKLPPVKQAITTGPTLVIRSVLIVAAYYSVI